MVSEFTLHHLPDFWKRWRCRDHAALKPANFYLRDIVFVSTLTVPSATSRRGRTTTSEPRLRARQRCHPHARRIFDLRLVMERMLTTSVPMVSADYHAPLHGTYLLRKPNPASRART